MSSVSAVLPVLRPLTYLRCLHVYRPLESLFAGRAASHDREDPLTDAEQAGDLLYRAEELLLRAQTMLTGGETVQATSPDC
ncbi:hypothetical protein [Sinomonas terrae]|uniref:HEPN domain-containing protein n=1 Tax=Sinomonas terrae TaxID=2908838 RepID=A0ABS9U4F6_9MICC|nr:hypothetical protein [Sinomonas terrae]MCH6471571.1 hypothetical protein [Sinomonas terrae]